MNIENITNPGQNPVEGDWIKITYNNRATETKQYHVPVDSPPQAPQKTIYTRADFIAVIPKEKVREIQTAAATNDDINAWVFNLPMLEKIDLNDLPTWFTDGLSAMVAEGIFTQPQMSAFLEVT